MVNPGIALNLADVPSALAGQLGIPNEYVAGLLATIVFIIMVTVPFIYARLSVIGSVIGLGAFFFCVGLQWIEGWLVMIVVLFVSGLVSFGVIRKLFG